MKVKIKIIAYPLLLFCFTTMIIGCIDKADENFCVKCGDTATSTLSGTSTIMQQNGISINDCEQITSNVYTAYICDKCTSPVVELESELQDNLGE